MEESIQSIGTVPIVIKLAFSNDKLELGYAFE